MTQTGKTDNNIHIHIGNPTVVRILGDCMGTIITFSKHQGVQKNACFICLYFLIKYCFNLFLEMERNWISDETLKKNKIMFVQKQLHVHDHLILRSSHNQKYFLGFFLAIALLHCIQEKIHTSKTKEKHHIWLSFFPSRSFSNRKNHWFLDCCTGRSPDFFSLEISCAHQQS